MTKRDAIHERLEITEAVGARLANALISGHPATVAYVGAENRPRISHRGSLQRLSDRQLAMWVRNPDGGLAKALGERARIAVLYSDFSDPVRRILFNCVGRAHVEPDEDLRRTVYDNSPELEREADPDRVGVAIVIDVDEISGFVDGEYIQMHRE